MQVMSASPALDVTQNAYSEVDVQGADLLDLRIRELERVDLEVLDQTVVVVALGDNSQALLDCPAEQDLRMCCKIRGA